VLKTRYFNLREQHRGSCVSGHHFACPEPKNEVWQQETSNELSWMLGRSCLSILQAILSPPDSCFSIRRWRLLGSVSHRGTIVIAVVLNCSDRTEGIVLVLAHPDIWRCWVTNSPDPRMAFCGCISSTAWACGCIDARPASSTFRSTLTCTK
jgi:hypothetical protein